MENELISLREENKAFLDQHDNAKWYVKSFYRHMYLVQIRKDILLEGKKKIGNRVGPTIQELQTAYRYNIDSLGGGNLYPEDLDWLDNEIDYLHNERRKQLDELTKRLLDSAELPDHDSGLGIGQPWASDLEYIKQISLKRMTANDGSSAKNTHQLKEWVDEEGKGISSENRDYLPDDVRQVVKQYEGHIDEKKRQKADALDAARNAKLKAEIVRERLKQPLPLSEAKWGLACTALILVVGVVLPLCSLAWEEFGLYPELRWRVLIAFCFSLVVLLQYLVRLMTRLVRTTGTPDAAEARTLEGEQQHDL
ncbi:MAG: hypothetical protein Q7T82_18255 [Armatimonadota bacterium]|nr:hypothetical protein [Armatimonadota bacterium]